METLSRRIKQSDAKHKNLENRISLIEDQLLEWNLIFQGLPETEFDDNNDAKIKVIKAMSMTMTEEDEDEKKTNAAETSIESVEHLGKYNPLRARPVKVKFGNKGDTDHVLKTGRNYPMESMFTRSTVKPLSMKGDYYTQSSKQLEGWTTTKEYVG